MNIIKNRALIFTLTQREKGPISVFICFANGDYNVSFPSKLSKLNFDH